MDRGYNKTTSEGRSYCGTNKTTIGNEPTNMKTIKDINLDNKEEVEAYLASVGDRYIAVFAGELLSNIAVMDRQYLPQALIVAKIKELLSRKI